ncbi:oxygenase MpaB family protein [Pantoea sp.]|uniref:oxygenase MpaB family protein n=1 Tax=Pantoea sp. TaxID=69393 RepID=UPI0031D4F2E1
MNLRARIEQQIFRINGLALNEFDLSQPLGDPGLFGPDHVIWRVHGDFPSMLCGGISALMLQMLHPSALAGVWDHSGFREDMLGRLRRTSQFIAVTTFGNRADAQTLIERVKRIHLRVTGTDNYGRAYAASDPHLLTWVHVAETRSFLAAHLRYKNPCLSRADQDRYYREAAVVAEALGAQQVPKSVPDVEAYLQAMRPELVYDARTREVLHVLMHAPAPSRIAKPAMRVILQAGAGLLPAWAQQCIEHPVNPLTQWRVNGAMAVLSGVLRWSIQRSAYSRAMQRVGRGGAG